MSDKAGWALSRRALGAGSLIAAIGAATDTPAGARAPVARPTAAGHDLAFDQITDGLEFPEGPIWMLDGSVLLVEVRGGRVTRVRPNGKKEVVASPGGGPSGAAVGPGGALYICNTGSLSWKTDAGLTHFAFGSDKPFEAGSGRIERIDLTTGKVDRLYDKVDGLALQWPDDLVLDGDGGFWFTDAGAHFEHSATYGGLYYGRLDGSSVKRAVFGSAMNGIGLSPDARTVYVSLTYERAIVGFDIAAPGQLASTAAGEGQGRDVASFARGQLLDSLKVMKDGDIVQLILAKGAGVAQVEVSTGRFTTVPMPDLTPTNMCFGGHDMRDAWICLATSGRLIKTRWPKEGLRPKYQA